MVDDIYIICIHGREEAQSYTQHYKLLRILRGMTLLPHHRVAQ